MSEKELVFGVVPLEALFELLPLCNWAVWVHPDTTNSAARAKQIYHICDRRRKSCSKM